MGEAEGRAVRTASRVAAAILASVLTASASGSAATVTAMAPRPWANANPAGAVASPVPGAVGTPGAAAAPAPKPGAAAYAEGRRLYEARDYDDAAAAFERAVAAAPRVSEYQGWLGRTYAELADRDRSMRRALQTRRTLERAVRLDGCNRDALTDLMRYYDAAPFFLGGSGSRAEKIRRCLASNGCPCAFGLDPDPDSE